MPTPSILFARAADARLSIRCITTICSSSASRRAAIFSTCEFLSCASFEAPVVYRECAASDDDTSSKISAMPSTHPLAACCEASGLSAGNRLPIKSSISIDRILRPAFCIELFPHTSLICAISLLRKSGLSARGLERVRCSILPVSVIITTRTALWLTGRSSQCLRVDRVMAGAATTATWPVILAKSCAERCSTSSTFTDPFRNSSIALRCGCDRGTTDDSWSTK